ncbi:hypothetical protein [Actinoallomurus sp. CA-150999]|uniref:hypothetical protein n=1 Tax=Actinoallomurus sp. CA-150999 TaxID=3239887 RepID=UPI003D8BC263
MDSKPTELPRLTVIGTGYLGATHAVCRAALGFEVLGVDVEKKKIAKLASGEVPFFEPGLRELLTNALDSGKLRFGTSFEEAGAFGDVHFICSARPISRRLYVTQAYANFTFLDMVRSIRGPMRWRIQRIQTRLRTFRHLTLRRHPIRDPGRATWARYSPGRSHTDRHGQAAARRRSARPCTGRSCASWPVG